MTSIISVLPMAPDCVTIMLITSLMTPPCLSIIPTCHGASVGTALEVAEYLSASVRNAARKEVPMSVTRVFGGPAQTTHQSQNFSAHSSAEHPSNIAMTWKVVAKSAMLSA